MSTHPIALRMDDVGASTKRYEVYSNRTWGLGPIRLSGNVLFLKYLRPFKAWGPYRELLADEWVAIFRLLESLGARLTVAVTATWVEREDRFIPFPDRFPRQAAALREGLRQGLVEIANHGLTHCVTDGSAFKPKWFASNRAFHREFWEWIPARRQEEHLRRSQDILQGFFGTSIVTFVPPGNVFTEQTLEIAGRCGLRYVSCDTAPAVRQGLYVVGEANVVPFHDRDLVFNGIAFLERMIRQAEGRPFCFVRELGERAALA